MKLSPKSAAVNHTFKYSRTLMKVENAVFAELTECNVNTLKNNNLLIEKTQQKHRQQH